MHETFADSIDAAYQAYAGAYAVGRSQDVLDGLWETYVQLRIQATLPQPAPLQQSEYERLMDEVAHATQMANEWLDRQEELIERARVARGKEVELAPPLDGKAFRDQNGVLVHNGAVYTPEEYEGMLTPSSDAWGTHNPDNDEPERFMYDSPEMADLWFEA